MQLLLNLKLLRNPTLALSVTSLTGALSLPLFLSMDGPYASLIGLTCLALVMWTTITHLHISIRSRKFATALPVSLRAHANETALVLAFALLLSFLGSQTQITAYSLPTYTASFLCIASTLIQSRSNNPQFLVRWLPLLGFGLSLLLIPLREIAAIACQNTSPAYALAPVSIALLLSWIERKRIAFRWRTLHSGDEPATFVYETKNMQQNIYQHSDRGLMKVDRSFASIHASATPKRTTLRNLAHASLGIQRLNFRPLRIAGQTALIATASLVALAATHYITPINNNREPFITTSTSIALGAMSLIILLYSGFTAKERIIAVKQLGRRRACHAMGQLIFRSTIVIAFCLSCILAGLYTAYGLLGIIPLDLNIPIRALAFFCVCIAFAPPALLFLHTIKAPRSLLQFNTPGNYSTIILFVFLFIALHAAASALILIFPSAPAKVLASLGLGIAVLSLISYGPLRLWTTRRFARLDF